MNDFYFRKPCDRILLNLILTRPYDTVVNESSHIMYYSKKNMSICMRIGWVECALQYVIRGFQQRCLCILLERGFISDKIYLVSQSECSSMFPTLQSGNNALEPYTVKWSFYVQEHNAYVEQHLSHIVNFTQQQYERDAEGVACLMIRRTTRTSRTSPKTFLLTGVAYLIVIKKMSAHISSLTRGRNQLLHVLVSFFTKMYLRYG